MHIRGLYFLLLLLLSWGVLANTWVPKPPSLSAKSYILMDHDSGDILAAKEPDARYEPASITKLMTAYVVYHALAQGLINIDDLITVSKKAWRTQGSRTFIEPRKKVSVSELLAGMVIQSGNDASIALAEHTAGSEQAFVQMMNIQAERLGLNHSHFTNVTGLPEENHVMSARDAAILARAVIHDFPGHYKMYAEHSYTYNGISQRNRNKLLWHNIGVDGLKTGYTKDAGYCLVASARQGDMRLISVVLNDISERKRFSNSAELLRHGFRFYRSAKLFNANQPLTEIRAWGGQDSYASIGVQKDIFVTFLKNNEKKIKTEMTIESSVDAPISKHTQLGIVRVYFEDKLLQEQPLVVLDEIPEGDIFTRISDGFLRLFQ